MSNALQALQYKRKLNKAIEDIQSVPEQLFGGGSSGKQKTKTTKHQQQQRQRPQESTSTSLMNSLTGNQQGNKKTGVSSSSTTRTAEHRKQAREPNHQGNAKSHLLGKWSENQHATARKNTKASESTTGEQAVMKRGEDDNNGQHETHARRKSVFSKRRNRINIKSTRDNGEDGNVHGKQQATICQPGNRPSLKESQTAARRKETKRPQTDDDHEWWMDDVDNEDDGIS